MSDTSPIQNDRHTDFIINGAFNENDASAPSEDERVTVPRCLLDKLGNSQTERGTFEALSDLIAAARPLTVSRPAADDDSRAAAIARPGVADLMEFHGRCQPPTPPSIEHPQTREPKKKARRDTTLEVCSNILKERGYPTWSAALSKLREELKAEASGEHPQTLEREGKVWERIPKQKLSEEMLPILVIGAGAETAFTLWDDHCEGYLYGAQDAGAALYKARPVPEETSEPAPHSESERLRIVKAKWLSKAIGIEENWALDVVAQMENHAAKVVAGTSNEVEGC